MATPIKQIAIWILEALREERRREPDSFKQRNEGEVLTPVRDQHTLADADISDALFFLYSRKFISSIFDPTIPNASRTIFITNPGLENLDEYELSVQAERDRHERELQLQLENKSEHNLWRYWNLADWGERFGMVSFLFGVFFIGYLCSSNSFLSRLINLIKDIKP